MRPIPEGKCIQFTFIWAGGDGVSARDLAQFALALEQYDGNPWFDEAISQLVAIYVNHPNDGQHGSEPIREVERIGEMFNERGGMKLMPAAHEEFALRCKSLNLRDSSGYISAPRSLEHRWNGIGEWMS